MKISSQLFQYLRFPFKGHTSIEKEDLSLNERRKEQGWKRSQREINAFLFKAGRNFWAELYTRKLYTRSAIEGKNYRRWFVCWLVSSFEVDPPTLGLSSFSPSRKKLFADVVVYNSLQRKSFIDGHSTFCPVHFGTNKWFRKKENEETAWFVLFFFFFFFFFFLFLPTHVSREVRRSWKITRCKSTRKFTNRTFFKWIALEFIDPLAETHRRICELSELLFVNYFNATGFIDSLIGFSVLIWQFEHVSFIVNWQVKTKFLLDHLI